jgi:hypothetical protein
MAGCSPLALTPSTLWPWAEEKPAVPSSLVVVWTDAVMHRPDGPSIRGFGGRIHFYRSDDEKPVRVDGCLTVYAFDDDDPDAPGVEPARKFVFTREQFPTHYAGSKLGHSYSVWVPWDEAGGPKKQISLVARFTPADGPTILGEHTRLILPGRDRDVGDRIRSSRISKRELTPGTGIRPAGHYSVVPDRQDKTGEQQRMLTTTIPIRPKYRSDAPQAGFKAPSSER